MSRILAIDYGQKRTGIAVTDTLQMIANGLATVETKELEKFIVDYVAKEDVSVIVVGKPTQMNGEDSENMKRIEPFFNRLKKLFPEKEITYYDERFTSVLAGLGAILNVNCGETMPSVVVSTAKKAVNEVSWVSVRIRGLVVSPSFQ